METVHSGMGYQHVQRGKQIKKKKKKKQWTQTTGGEFIHIYNKHHHQKNHPNTLAALSSWNKSWKL